MFCNYKGVCSSLWASTHTTRILFFVWRSCCLRTQRHLYSRNNTSAIHANNKKENKLSTSSLMTPRCYSCPLSPVSPQIMHSARRHSSPRLGPGSWRYCSAAASNKPRSCRAERVAKPTATPPFPSSLQLGESGVWRPSRLP